MSKQRKLTDTKYSRYRVLIYGAGGRQALPVCRGFYEIGCQVTVYCGSKLDTGYLTKFKHHVLLYDKNNTQQSFYEYGIRFIKTGQYDLVVPLGDEGAIFLSQRKQMLSQYAKLAVNDWDVQQYAVDKSKTMHVCMQQGISAPITLETDDVLGQMDKGAIGYPVVVKPHTAVGSIGFNIFRDREKLAAYLENYDNANGPILVQEYIEQGDAPQYRADLFRDRDGNYKAALVGKVTRWYPLDGGSGIFAMTIHDEQILQDCKCLLDTLNWNGYANIDMVWDEKHERAKILEINGRTGASIKLDYVAGINISQLILENELGLPVTDMLAYEDGKKISCFLPDLLWLLKSPRRFKTEPSWFDRAGVKDSIFSWDDPLPMIGFLLTSVVSFGKSMSKRKRA